MGKALLGFGEQKYNRFKARVLRRGEHSHTLEGQNNWKPYIARVVYVSLK